MQEELLKAKEDAVKEELKYTKQIQELEIKLTTTQAEKAETTVILLIPK